MANYTILLIDYEPRSIERFRDPLIGAGYGIEIATDGVSGIEAFHRLNPDLVLVEAMIPKKHGFEVCQELKRTPHGRKTPVIITTGVYKGRKYRTQALHIYGCDEYIEKPIAPEHLLEIVGKFLKPGPSGAPPRSTDPGPGQTESGGAPESHETSGTMARAVTSARIPDPAPTSSQKPPPVPHALVGDETEDEIMARLDAILPGGDKSTEIFVPMGAALAAAVDPIAVAPDHLETSPAIDPFADIRDELNAALGALTADFEPEPAPLTPEAIPEFIPSDQISTPTVLEALPTPEAEVPVPEADVPIPPLPEPPPILPVERPGQVVDFDTKRSRKHKKAAKQNKSRGQQPAQAQRPQQPVPVAAKPEPPAARALEPVAPVAELKLPRGTIVESQIEAPVARRGVPVWIWAIVGLIAVAGSYFIFSHDTPDRSVASAPQESLPEPVADVHSEPPPPVQQLSETEAAPPQAAVPQTPEPATAVSIAPPPVQTAQPPAAKKPAEKPPAVSVAKNEAKAPASAPPPQTARKEPSAAHSVSKWKEPAATTAAATTPAPAAPSGPDDTVAGVETLPDPTAAPPVAASTAGALIPIDEADKMPVSLSRKLPVYSEQARQMRLSGTVILNVLVNEKGSVEQVVLVSGVTGADLNDSAIRAAKSWTYRPATKNGVPVKVWKSEQIVFKR